MTPVALNSPRTTDYLRGMLSLPEPPMGSEAEEIPLVRDEMKRQEQPDSYVSNVLVPVKSPVVASAAKIPRSGLGKVSPIRGPKEPTRIRTTAEGVSVSISVFLVPFWFGDSLGHRQLGRWPVPEWQNLAFHPLKTNYCPGLDGGVFPAPVDSLWPLSSVFPLYPPATSRSPREVLGPSSHKIMQADRKRRPFLRNRLRVPHGLCEPVRHG